MKYTCPSRRLKYAAFILPVFLFLSVCGQSRRPVKRVAVYKEQTSFSSEEKVSRPVKLPQSILKQLAEYDDGQLGKCQQDKSMRRPGIASHFTASKIDLDGDKRPDLLVQAQTSCFMGAHNTTFWIFTGKGTDAAPAYELVFDIAVDFLNVLKTSTNGYRDIETASHTAVELYTIEWKFDGQKYQKSECRITDEHDKVSIIDCNP